MLLEFIDRGDRVTLAHRGMGCQADHRYGGDAIPTAEARLVGLLTAEDYEARVERVELG